MSRQELEESAAKKYHEQMEALARKEKHRQETLEKTKELCAQKQLSKEEQDSLVQRIYEDHRNMKTKKLEVLLERRDKANNEGRSDKKLSEDELGDFVQRMYNREVDKKNNTMRALKSKYEPEPEKKPLGKSQQQAMAERLSKSNREETRQRLFEKYVAPLDPKTTKLAPESVKAMADRLCTTKAA